jgi:hypothetical protein
MFLWPFVLSNSEVSFSKQDFESMDSTLVIIVFGNHFFWSFLCILLGIRTQTYRNPTYFLSRKVSTQTLATLDPFCLSFQTCWDFKARCHFVPFDKKPKSLGNEVAILVKFWREIVVLVRVLLIESSPRFTNRVQSAFY